MEDIDTIAQRVLKREDEREQDQRLKEAEATSKGAALMDELFDGLERSSVFERLCVRADRAARSSDIIVDQFETTRVCTIKQRGAEIDFHWNGEVKPDPFASFKSAVEALALRCRKIYRRDIDGSGRHRQPGVYSQRPPGL